MPDESFARFKIFCEIREAGVAEQDTLSQIFIQEDLPYCGLMISLIYEPDFTHNTDREISADLLNEIQDLLKQKAYRPNRHRYRQNNNDDDDDIVPLPTNSNIYQNAKHLQTHNAIWGQFPTSVPAQPYYPGQEHRLANGNRYAVEEKIENYDNYDEIAASHLTRLHLANLSGTFLQKQPSHPANIAPVTTPEQNKIFKSHQLSTEHTLPKIFFDIDDEAENEKHLLMCSICMNSLCDVPSIYIDNNGKICCADCFLHMHPEWPSGDKLNHTRQPISWIEVMNYEKLLELYKDQNK